jgi:hypothetical protein
MHMSREPWEVPNPDRPGTTMPDPNRPVGIGDYHGAKSYHYRNAKHLSYEDALENADSYGTSTKVTVSLMVTNVEQL